MHSDWITTLCIMEVCSINKAFPVSCMKCAVGSPLLHLLTHAWEEFDRGLNGLTIGWLLPRLGMRGRLPHRRLQVSRRTINPKVEGPRVQGGQRCLRGVVVTSWALLHAAGCSPFTWGREQHSHSQKRWCVQQFVVRAVGVPAARQVGVCCVFGLARGQ